MKIIGNGLAKLRGRFKEPPFQTARKQAAYICLYFLANQIWVACWCFLIKLNFQTAHRRP